MNAESRERPRQPSQPGAEPRTPRALRVSFDTPSGVRRPTTPRYLWKLWSIRRLLRRPKPAVKITQKSAS